MPIEKNVTLSGVTMSFCDRCNVEQGLITGFLLVPAMQKAESAMKNAGWEERDEGHICSNCVAEEKATNTDSDVGIDTIATLVGAKKKE